MRKTNTAVILKNIIYELAPPRPHVNYVSVPRKKGQPTYLPTVRRMPEGSPTCGGRLPIFIRKSAKTGSPGPRVWQTIGR